MDERIKKAAKLFAANIHDPKVMEICLSIVKDGQHNMKEVKQAIMTTACRIMHIIP